MKTLILLLSLFAVTAQAQTYVDGYYRKDGTYVAPHFRSEADGYKYNNYEHTRPKQQSPWVDTIEQQRKRNEIDKDDGGFVGGFLKGLSGE